MKTVIMAGGAGTRLAEETSVRPKPMVEIGGRPILWHIMMHYSYYKHNEFVIALGYKGEYIKKYFADYCALHGNLTVHLGNGNNRVEQHDHRHAPWEIKLIETGVETLTGGRLKRLQDYVGDETFLYTLGDGLSNVNLDDLLAFHRKHGKLATVTAVQPPARYGYLRLEGDQVTQFEEKPQQTDDLINGGFMVLEPKIFDYIDGDQVMFEGPVMEQLAKEGELVAYRHEGFWACMDTLRDKMRLQEMWESQEGPPWVMYNPSNG